MIYNYIKSAYRYFLRHKFYSFLNITGLAIGFAASTLLALFVWQETSYDNFHEKGDRIVRVTMESKTPVRHLHQARTGALVANVFSKELPEVEKAVRFGNVSVTVQYEDKLYEEDKFLYADSTFFDIFSFNLYRGNPKEALNGPNKVVLTKEAALRYFDEKDPVGESILINNEEFIITGIIEKAPENSQIKYDFIGSFASLKTYYNNPTWLSTNFYTYLLLQSPGSIDQLQGKIFDYMKTKEKETRMTGDNYLTFHLEPLKDVHVYSTLPGLEPNIDVRYIYIFMIVSILVLFIACINYMNLATARSVDRGVEVGIRKVLGAQKNQLFWQYINEAFISVVAATLIALVIVNLTLPFFNLMLDRSYTMDLLLNKEVLLVIIGVITFVSLAAGAYPSLIMTKLAPSKTLKGAFKSSVSGLLLRRGLIIFQFIISSTLIISSFIIYNQLSFIQHSNLGYQKEHVIIQRINNKVVEKIDELRNRLSQYPQIEEITLAFREPMFFVINNPISISEENQILAAVNPVEQNFLNTLNIKLVAGKDFSIYDQEKALSDSALLLLKKETSVIINEKASRELGLTPEEAIGKNAHFRGGNAVIIGVVKDFHFAPMHQEIGPLVLYVEKLYNRMFIRVKGDDMASTLELIGNNWKEVAPLIPFDPKFLDQEYNAVYSNEQKLGYLSLFFTAITVLLGCLGLLGLSALLISHRTKEIGIRKVLGASIPQIVHVLSKEYVKLVIIAFLVAVPLSWYAMDQWLQTFTYKIDMPYIVYFITGGLLLALALLILSTQTIKAALRNPVDVLKSE
ncbi:MAG: ABC transporter permease [Candidatus Cyclobacteriaceae bacterium M2_1C_046]